MSRKVRRSWNEQEKKQNTSSKENINVQDYKRISKKIELIPRTIHQEDYISQLLDPDKVIVFATGLAGSGKTMLATLAAIKMLKSGDIKKIVITRPAVGVEGEKHGFLPGDLNQKMEPWVKPIFDVFHEHYSMKDTAAMVESGIIEISPLAYMRGRTFKDSFIIADEMQNSNVNMMKMLLTRIGENSKMVVTGDLLQKDKQFFDDNGLLDFINILKRNRSDMIEHVHFDRSDVQRHPVVAEVLKMYGDE